jgi:hypothetical protein
MGLPGSYTGCVRTEGLTKDSSFIVLTNERDST